MPNLDCSKTATEKDKPSGGKGTKHNDAKSGDIKKKGIGKMHQEQQRRANEERRMRDFMISILPKYADDDANTLAGHIMYLLVKQDHKNYMLLLDDYMGTKAKSFCQEMKDWMERSGLI